MKRNRVLLAYDIGQPRLQAQVRKKISHEASSQQLSAYECYLNKQEQKALLLQLAPLITEESLLACQIDNRRKTYYLGQAKPALDEHCLVID